MEPITDVVNIIAPIGTAVASFIPTSGDTMEPRRSGSMPSSALALPARCPCFSIANVKVLVSVMPIVII